MTDYEPERFWSDVAEEVAKRPGDNVQAGDDTPYYRYKRARFLDRFLDSLDVRGLKVLEVGCGPGGNLRALARRNPARLVGADISQTMLDLAGAMIDRDHVAAELLKIDGASLPFGDQELDLSLTVTVLHHNPDEDTFQSLVGEICRVTGQSVVLVEDTNPVVNTHYAMIERPISLYEQAVAKHGFTLQSAEFLDTRATFFAFRAIARVWGTVDSRQQQHAEGAPVPPLVDWASKVGVAMAKPFDNMWHDHGGLTKMVFTRNR